MRIDVDPKFIGITRLKASLTRAPIDLDAPLFVERVPASNVTAIAEYWAHKYDWFTLSLCISVHHRSKRPDAIPLLFIHGWPGSFLEVGPILSGLLDPPSRREPAFHVVASSVPGFGSSPAPTKRGFGLVKAGAAFHQLMLQLGYQQYVIQGGDFGAHTARYMGAAYLESVRSVLCNLWGVPANVTGLAHYASGQTTAEEGSYVEFLQQKRALHQDLLGYRGHGALADGHYARRHPGIDQVNQEGTLDYAFPYVPVPVGVLQYFGDAGYGAPRDWRARSGNVTYLSRKDVSLSGGHFPAAANPEDLLMEVRKFWGTLVGGWSRS
ncbi:hypothetical protein DL764_005920 [Monosporascus ibericus]|uniref:AB hydrolase-1 domain-containing protein n=1 Tax=Monosporascus ibericus TaxID=155417 RepID=A0A4V1XAB5_9PEZI|nr:hypothetical protein DL764_005920 [Monosporascus ibericus]